MRKIAISDIHGCSKTFRALLDKVGLSSSDRLYVLGDYVDRGPDSKGVIDTILDLQSKGFFVKCLRGNHDQTMLDARQDILYFNRWLDRWSGEATMKSFGVNSLREIPAEYWQFLENLEFHLEVDEYILVHAGLDWENHNDHFADKDELLFGRYWYEKIDYDWLGDRIIVHGHTPVFRDEIEKDLALLPVQRYLNIDNGCVFAHRLDPRRNLCAFDMTGRHLFFQRNVDNMRGVEAKK